MTAALQLLRKGMKKEEKTAYLSCAKKAALNEKLASKALLTLFSSSLQGDINLNSL